MNKYEWIETIKNKCESVNTYKDAFDPVIDTLATILEQRDDVMTLYEQEGAQPVLVGEGSTGQLTHKRNPLLTQWSDLNKDALAYWRDLGLTPNGLKRINEEELKGRTKKDGIEEALKSLKI